MKPNLQQRYIDGNGRLTLDGVALIDGLDRRLAAAESKLAAIAAIAGPTGGAVTDTQARAAINAIIAGAQ